MVTMNYEQFEIKLESLGYFGCGLNSDWCVQAWCLSIGFPNRHDGGIYLLDKEQDYPEDGPAYEVVERFYQYDGHNDEINSLIEFETAEKALDWVLLLDSVKTWEFPSQGGE